MHAIDQSLEAIRCLDRYLGIYSKKRRLLRSRPNFSQRQQLAPYHPFWMILRCIPQISRQMLLDVWADIQADIRKKDGPLDFAQILHKGGNWPPYQGMSSFINFFIERYSSRILVPLDINNNYPKYFSKMICNVYLINYTYNWLK